MAEDRNAMSPDNDDLARARAAWTYRGKKRPPFAVAPEPGQESVWDYPRPPAIVPSNALVEVYAGNRRLVRTRDLIRVLETGSPPTIYLPLAELDEAWLRPSRQRSFCEWKGPARYYHVQGDQGLIENAIWTYPEPLAGAEVLADRFSCYPSKLRCVLDGETVRAQAGGFYGGWITSRIVGPWKGEPGTGHW